MRKKLMYGIGLIVVVILFAFGYYTISPLFRHIKIDEQAPVKTNDVNSTNSVKPNVAAIVGTSGHPASGSVSILQGENKSYIRYEDFKTINGPDVYVYLAKDLDAKDFVNISRLKATEGNVNYEIPEGVDVRNYRYVMMWCKRFGVLFNYADISVIGSDK